jgi:hypothetical protein
VTIPLPLFTTYLRKTVQVHYCPHQCVYRHPIHILSTIPLINLVVSINTKSPHTGSPIGPKPQFWSNLQISIKRSPRKLLPPSPPQKKVSCKILNPLLQIYQASEDIFNTISFVIYSHKFLRGFEIATTYAPRSIGDKKVIMAGVLRSFYMAAIYSCNVMNTKRNIQ